MLKELIDVAAGKVKADLVIKNCRYVDVFNGTVSGGDIAVKDGYIAGVGNYQGKEEIEGKDLIVLPGFIDGHMHIESTQLTPENLAKLIVPRGTTTIIADSHEIVNVLGEKGLKYFMEAVKGLPLDVIFMLPSCVPATPFEDSGATVDAKQTAKLLKDENIYGLGEFMNYVGVINADEECLKKIEAAHSLFKPVDGHAPGLSGNSLNAYAAAGILTDHECRDGKELKEKISKGMYVHLREGSATKNAVELSEGVTAANLFRVIGCTDDRHAEDLVESGHMDNLVRVLVGAGMDPIWAVKIATINCATAYGLKNKGAIAPGYIADMVCVKDLKDFKAEYVLKNGKMVAKGGRALFEKESKVPLFVLGSVNIGEINPEDFQIKIKGNKVKVINLIPDNVLTKMTVEKVEKCGDAVKAVGDLLKIAVVERHKGSGKIGLGMIKGYGLKGGALALTVSHDSHNIIVLGDSDEDMYAAVKHLEKCGGGMVIARNKKAEDYLPLEIAGLMTKMNAEEFKDKLSKMIKKAHEMGVKEDLQPFMSLSFLALAVIPDIKITDRGLFDVNKFEFVPIEAE